MDKIQEINHLFTRCFDKSDTFLSAKKTSDLDQEVRTLITKDIPACIKEHLGNEDYLVLGSVGKGLATKTPWIAILDKGITSSTREGVYIVFLFSSDYRHVYLTFAQGITVPGQFGPKLNKKTIISNTQRIRELLNWENDALLIDDKADIADKSYKAGVIYYSMWDTTDDKRGGDLINLYLEVYKTYKAALKMNNKKTDSDIQKTFSVNRILETIRNTGLIYSDSLVKRFAFSLMSKRFLILSGLAGSGKTQLAISFASAMVENKHKQMCVVSVGADWTNHEPLLGFPNALHSGKYIRPGSGALDLLIEANRKENVNKPFFLILDEMNLSYVERYFADFLSAMESKERIKLWDIAINDDSMTEMDGVPQSIDLPKNLFIIGTINVDETTYMFSPKVLDRANVIEFKIGMPEMEAFLGRVSKIERRTVDGAAAEMGADFVEKANITEFNTDISMTATLQLYFKELKKINAEFGYRTITEIFRFMCQAKDNDDTEQKLTDDEIMDAAIVQKLLPKLHGSRKKLVPVLTTLWDMCDAGIGIELAEKVPEQTKYPLTADKLLRMYRGAIDNGFTSFAEA